MKKIKIHNSWSELKNNTTKTYKLNGESKLYKTKGVCVGICKRLMSGDKWTENSFECFHVVFDDEGNDPSFHGWRILFS